MALPKFRRRDVVWAWGRAKARNFESQAQARRRLESCAGGEQVKSLCELLHTRMATP